MDIVSVSSSTFCYHSFDTVDSVVLTKSKWMWKEQWINFSGIIFKLVNKLNCSLSKSSVAFSFPSFLCWWHIQVILIHSINFSWLSTLINITFNSNVRRLQENTFSFVFQSLHILYRSAKLPRDTRHCAIIWFDSILLIPYSQQNHMNSLIGKF